MCGLYGAVSTTLTNKEIDNVIDLGVITQLRGRHSSGLVAVYKNKDKPVIEWIKGVGNSSKLLYSKDADALFEKHPYILAGHCRHATKGSITPKNAHPFQEGHIIGMHNGTLYGSRDHGDMTDSQVFFKKLASDGLYEALKDTWGAYAFVWIDQKKATLNLLRNDQRPLFIMHGGGATFWASEASMLNLIRSRSTIDYTVPSSIEKDTLIEIKIGNVHDVKINPVKIARTWMSSMQKDKEDEQEVTGPFRPMTAAEAERAELLREREKQKKTSHPSEQALKMKTTTIGASVPITVMGPVRAATPKNAVGQSLGGERVFRYSGYRLLCMDKEKARRILDRGCAACDRSAKLLDKVYFYNKESFLCATCKEIPARVEYVGANPNDLWESRAAFFDKEAKPLDNKTKEDCGVQCH